jgi:hypothetical protein
LIFHKTFLFTSGGSKIRIKRIRIERMVLLQTEYLLQRQRQKIASSNNSGTLYSTGKPRKRYSNSIGNKSRFAEQQIEKKKMIGSPLPDLKKKKFQLFFNNMRNNCEFGKNRGDDGCFMEHFIKRYYVFSLSEKEN